MDPREHQGNRPQEAAVPYTPEFTKESFTETLAAAFSKYQFMVVDQLPHVFDENGSAISDPIELDPSAITDTYIPYDLSSLGAASDGYKEWVTIFYEGLRYQQKLADEPSDRSPELEELSQLCKNLSHDLGSSIFQILTCSLTDDEDERLFPFYANPYMVAWPLHTMRRVYKQITNTADHQEIEGTRALRELCGVFKTLAVLSYPDVAIDIDFKTPFTCRGDLDYLLGVLANPLKDAAQIATSQRKQNAHVLLRVIPDDTTPENIIIQIRDNTGGMSAHLLEHSENNPTIQKALERGISERDGGTGRGLAIVHEIVRDHFGGTIHMFNEPYPETDEQGLVINISIPGKLTNESKAGS